MLVFNGVNNTQIAALRTCTQPMGMAETIDGNKLLVGCDSAHIMSVFDLVPAAAADLHRYAERPYAIRRGFERYDPGEHARRRRRPSVSGFG